MIGRRDRPRSRAFSAVHFFFMSMAFFSLAGVQAQSVAPALPRLVPGFSNQVDAQRFRSLCPNVHVERLDELSLQDMETRLLCGDANPDAIGMPWASIPPNQAAYFMRGFLQSRGYHRPAFVQDGENLFVTPGSLSRLSRFQLRGGPPTWEPPKRRLIDGLPLTPELLDDLEAWSLGQIKNEGYACAKTISRADPLTGEVLVALEPADEKRIAGFEDRGDSGLQEGVLDRYNAFRVGDLYRDYLVTLTRRRTQEDGFLQTYAMSPRCEPGSSVIIARDVVLGPSRTIRIGVGASNDLGARFRAILRRNRIGSSASSAQGRLQVSYLNPSINRQAIDASFRWFYSAGESRSYVEPSSSFEHAAEAAFETRNFENKVLHGWNKETSDGQFEIRTGPTFLVSRLARGVGTGDVSLAYAELSARLTSHDFESFVSSPRSGGTIEAVGLLTLKRWGANFTAQKLQLQGQKLWNLFRYDPPLFILATRFNLSSVFSPDEDLSLDLPQRFLTFLGGEQDLRGFERSSLPRSGKGALSGATGSLEGRFHKVILRKIDVFSFVDAGLLGRARFQLERPLLLSPGAGLRWETPVGVFRTYFAWRMAVAEEPDAVPFEREYRVGLTFGEEF